MTGEGRVHAAYNNSRPEGPSSTVPQIPASTQVSDGGVSGEACAANEGQVRAASTSSRPVMLTSAMLGIPPMMRGEACARLERLCRVRSGGGATLVDPVV